MVSPFSVSFATVNSAVAASAAARWTRTSSSRCDANFDEIIVGERLCGDSPARAAGMFSAPYGIRDGAAK
jgi:hypothetical protein